MNRTVTVFLYAFVYDISVNNAGYRDGILPADAEAAGWFPEFGAYREDSDGRFLYLYNPACASLRGFLQNLEWVRAHPRPHFSEIYSRADIIDETTGQVYKTLRDVTFLEIFEGIGEVFQEFERQRLINIKKRR